MPAVEALLEAPAAGNPVLRSSPARSSRPRKLLKLALADAGRAGLRQLCARRPRSRAAGDRHGAGAGPDRPPRRRPPHRRRLRRQPRDPRAGARRSSPSISTPRPSGRGRSTTTRSTRSAPRAEEGDLSRLVDSVGDGDAATLQAELLRLAERRHRGHPADPRGASADEPARPAAGRGRARQQRRRRHGVTGQVVVLEGKRRDRRGSLQRWRSDALAEGDRPAAGGGAAGQGVGRPRRRSRSTRNCSRSAARRRGCADGADASRGDDQIFSPHSRWQIMSSWSRVE